MSTLCTRLKNVDEAGVYQLNCSADELREAADRAGFAILEADIAGVHGKGEFLAAIAQAVKAPDWFGHNLDALADALGDLSWCRAPGYVLLLRNGGDTFGLLDDHPVVTEIFAGAAAFWKSQGKAFWVFYC
ncbi:MAG: barstar family protein [Nitrosomonadales bacterium]|nr:barstar family protein [Nitrosomonadales bacterium]